MVDQIGADRVVPVDHERHFQLGADAIGAGDQYSVPVQPRLETEESAKRSDFGENAAGKSGPRQPADAADCLVARVDIDAGGFVVH
jgi:hypothetical protein